MSGQAIVVDVVYTLLIGALLWLGSGSFAIGAAGLLLSAQITVLEWRFRI
jgi:hypothetical protein